LIGRIASFCLWARLSYQHKRASRLPLPGNGLDPAVPQGRSRWFLILPADTPVSLALGNNQVIRSNEARRVHGAGCGHDLDRRHMA